TMSDRRRTLCAPTTANVRRGPERRNYHDAGSPDRRGGSPSHSPRSVSATEGTVPGVARHAKPAKKARRVPARRGLHRPRTDEVRGPTVSVVAARALGEERSAIRRRAQGRRRKLHWIEPPGTHQSASRPAGGDCNAPDA